MNEHDMQSGISYCTKAIEFNDTMDLAYFYRAGIYVAMISKRDANADYENYKAAIADYTKVLELDGTNAEALFYRGGAHSEMGFLEPAIEDYLASISINENQPYVFNSLAVCYARTGSPGEAMKSINKDIELDEEYANA